MHILRKLAISALTGVFLSLTACGEPADETGPATTPTTPSAPVTEPAGKQHVTNVTVNVSAGKASVQPGTRVRAERGTTVKITVTSDAADEFHLHGYDESARLEPGRPAVVQIRADRAGVFEAELHGAHLRLFELQVG